MRISLELVVVMVVILVAAVVTITFFGVGVEQGSQMLDAEASCINMATVSCNTFNELPPTWSSQKIRYGKTMETCAGITGKGDCTTFKQGNRCTGVCKDTACDAKEVLPGICDKGKYCCKS